MPVISTFFGIVVRMYYREHGLPHFHEYQGQEATFTFDGTVLAGAIRSRTASRLIREWAVANASQLEANWQRARDAVPLERIEPLNQGGSVDKLPAVIQAQHVADYVLTLTFSDGLVADVDFRDWLDGPVFEPLHDHAYFRRFFVEAGAVVWPNGADIAPETLYERARDGAAA